MLADVSVEYYAKLERGHIAGASSSVLDAISRALQLDDTERAHLLDLARFQFLDPAARDFYPDWDLFAQMCVAIMRAEAGRDPHDRALQDLVGELCTRSDTFRTLWGAHDVRTHGTGTKRFSHPVAGELTLAYEELTLTAEPGLTLGSPSRRHRRALTKTHAD